MKRSKKIDEVSYGIFFRQAAETWSDTERSILEDIKKKYKFENYDLPLKLYEKMNAVGSIHQAIKCNPKM